LVRAGALTAAILAAGCAPPPAAHPRVCTPGQFAILPATRPFGVVGKPFTVGVALECDGGAPSSADVTIRDPDNLSVAPTDVVLPGVVSDLDVTFTPPLSGQYHVTVVLQPSFGLVQLDVQVAADHAAEAAAFDIDSEPLVSCTQLEITPADRLLCVEPVTELFSADGGLLQKMPSKTAAYANGTLWVVDDGGLSRWVEADGGDGFIRSPDMRLSLNLPPPLLLLPFPGGVVAYDRQTTLQRIQIADGGLAVTATAHNEFNGSIAWSDGTDALVLGDNGEGMCHESFEAPGSSCLGAFRAAVGVGHDGIWILNDSFFSHHTLDLWSSLTPTRLALPDDVPIEGPPPPFAWEHAPSFVSADLRFIARHQSDGFALDFWSASATFVGASGSAVLFKDQGTLSVYRR
jgi:hypothetical protein